MNTDVFLGATDEEMLSLLGLYALPLMVEPDKGLIDARRGVFTQVESDALGMEFRQAELLNIGKRFLQRWAMELAKAICGNDTLYKEVRERGLTQLGARSSG